MSTARRLSAVVVALAALGACSHDRSAAPSAAGRQLAGTFTRTGVAGADPCGTDSAHPDLHAGALVAVFDTTGNLLVTGELGDGTAEGPSCVHPIELPRVADLDAYRVTVGGVGPIEVTREALAASDGALDLRFGT